MAVRQSSPCAPARASPSKSVQVAMAGSPAVLYPLAEAAMPSQEENESFLVQSRPVQRCVHSTLPAFAKHVAFFGCNAGIEYVGVRSRADEIVCILPDTSGDTGESCCA